MLQNMNISNKCCSSERSIHQRILKKIYKSVSKNIYIDSNETCLLSSKSAYYYDFWRSCDTEDWSSDVINTLYLIVFSVLNCNIIMISEGSCDTEDWSNDVINTLYLIVFSVLNCNIIMISEGSCDTEDWSNDVINTLYLIVFSVLNCNIIMISEDNVTLKTGVMM